MLDRVLFKQPILTPHLRHHNRVFFRCDYQLFIGHIVSPRPCRVLPGKVKYGLIVSLLNQFVAAYVGYQIGVRLFKKLLHCVYRKLLESRIYTQILNELLHFLFAFKFRMPDCRSENLVPNRLCRLPVHQTRCVVLLVVLVRGSGINPCVSRARIVKHFDRRRCGRLWLAIRPYCRPTPGHCQRVQVNPVLLFFLRCLAAHLNFRERASSQPRLFFRNVLSRIKSKHLALFDLVRHCRLPLL